MASEYAVEGNVIRLRVQPGTSVEPATNQDPLALLQQIATRIDAISAEQEQQSALLRKLHGTDVSSSAIYTAAFPVYGGHPDAASVVANIGANATILWPNTQVVLQPNTGQVAVYSHGTLEQQFEALNTPADTGQQPGQFVQVAQQDIRDDASAVLPESMGVPIYKLLEIGSVVVGLLSAASIVLWLLVDTPLVHPAVSLMLLVASPLGYLMGRAARKQLLG